MKNDFTYLAILTAFFALSVLFVFACDKIIGSDDEALAISGDLDEDAEDSEDDELAVAR